MTDQQKTDTRTSLQQVANDIYELILKGERQGYKIVLRHGWTLNLEDSATGERTPLVGVLNQED